MPLPEIIRVKLSSEAAEYVSLTPVVTQDMPTRELIESMLGITGKDAERIRELLRRGTLVTGASRIRWQGWDAELAEIEALLATFPDSAPGRRFVAEQCVKVAILAGPSRIELSRDAASERRVFRRGSFWDLLMRIASERQPQYVEYSYKERADVYRADLDSAAVRLLQDGAGALRYASLESHVRNSHPEALELYVIRRS